MEQKENISVIQKRGSGCLLTFIFFLLVFLSLPETAHSDMRSGYPKRFRFYGVIELDYTDYSSETSSDGRKNRSSRATLKQRYNLNLEGYIYHPRLAVFSASVTYQNKKEIKGYISDSKDIGYNLSATFLPYRPVSFYVYAIRDYFTFKASDVSTQNSSSDQFGARLGIHTKILPAIDLEYYRYDYSSGNLKTESNFYSIRVHGRVAPIRTSYGFGYAQSDFSGPSLRYNAQYFYGYTITTVKTATLLTSFVCSKQPFSKETGFSASLQFIPTRRFSHYYSYDYNSSQLTFQGSEAAGTETTTIKTTIQMLRGSWSYRLTDRLRAAVGLNYNINKQDKEIWTSNGIVSSLDYRRPLAGLELSSHYTLFLRNDNLRGSLTEHNIDLGLRTLKFKAGTLYADYVFVRSFETVKPIPQLTDASLGDVPTGNTQELKIDTTIHLFRLGLRGRGLRFVSNQAYWAIEGEYLNSVTHGQKPASLNLFDSVLEDSSLTLQSYSKNTNQYNFYGNLAYPFGRGATISSRAGHVFGINDSKKIKKLYYDIRLNYPLSRRLLVSAWWQEIWNEIEGSSQKDRNYEIYATYGVGKVFFSLSYLVLKTEEGAVVTQNTRLFTTIKRFF